MGTHVEVCVKTARYYFGDIFKQMLRTLGRSNRHIFQPCHWLGRSKLVAVGKHHKARKRCESPGWKSKDVILHASKRQASCKQASYKHAKERARMTPYKQASSKQEKERSDITQSPQALLRQISKQAAEHTKRGKQLLSKSKMESEWRSLRKRREYLSIRCKHYGLK